MTNRWIEVAGNLEAELRGYVARMVKEWRYNRELFRIACDKNVPYVKPSGMKVIFGWIMRYGRFPTHEQAFKAMRTHPEYYLRNDGSLGTDDEVLFARVYNFLVGAYREMEVIFSMQDMNPKGRFLKTVMGDVKDRIDFIYRLNDKQLFFAVRRDERPTHIHEEERRKTICSWAIQLNSKWDHENPHGLHLVPKWQYEKYTIE